MVHRCISCTWEAETQSLRVPGQPHLHNQLEASPGYITSFLKYCLESIKCLLHKHSEHTTWSKYIVQNCRMAISENFEVSVLIPNQNWFTVNSSQQLKYLFLMKHCNTIQWRDTLIWCLYNRTPDVCTTDCHDGSTI